MTEASSPLEIGSRDPLLGDLLEGLNPPQLEAVLYRGPALLIWDRSQPGVWRVRQILDDPAGDHDWGFDVQVDLEASDEEGVVVMQLVDAGRM